MTKHIRNNLRLVALAMGITLATSAGAQQAANHDESSKANDLLCVAIEGMAPLKSALAVLRVEKNGQAQGALCYLSSLYVTELADCHLVAGRVLTAPGAVKSSYVGLVGTGIDNNELTQNDVAVKFEAVDGTGTGSAAQFAVAVPAAILTNNTGVGSAVQSRCKYDPVRSELSAINFAKGNIGPFLIPSSIYFPLPSSNVQTACPGLPSLTTINALPGSSVCANQGTETSCLNPGYGYSGILNEAYICKWTNSKMCYNGSICTAV